MLTRSQLLPYVAASFLIALSIMGLRAQTAPDISGETVVLPAFTVSSDTIDRYRATDAVSSARVRTQLIETPSSISVLTRDFLEDVAPLRLFDAAKYVAGIQDGRGNTYQDRVIIRGFESTGRTVDNFIDTGAHNLDEALIERLEINKGPNAILVPGGNPGGAMNIVSKAPEFTRKRSFTALVGDFDAQKVTLDITESLPNSERFAYRLIGAYQDTERYWSSAAKLRRRLIAPQFTWRISPTTELVTRYDYLQSSVFREPALIIDSSVTQRGQTPILGPGFSHKSLNGAPEWGGLSYKKHSLSLQFSTSFNKYLSMRLAGRFQRFDEDSDQASLSPPSLANRYDPKTGILTPDYIWALQTLGLPYDETTNPYVATHSPYYDPTAVPLRGERAVDDWSEDYAIQNDWVFNYEASWAKLQTVAGLAYTHGDSAGKRFNGTIAPINLYDLENQDSSVIWDTTPARASKGKDRNSQFYINQRITAWENRIAITGGYLHYNTDSKEWNLITGAAPSAIDDSKDMYLGSILIRPTESTSLYYSYSTNAAPDRGNGLWREGKQHEWGAKAELFNRRLSINFAYFEITQTNFSVPNPAYYAGDFTLPSTLLADFNNHGTELEINGAITRNLSLVGSITHLKMRDSLGRPVRAVADNLAGAMLSYRFGDGMLKGLGLTTGVSYTDERAGELVSAQYTPLNVPTQQSFFLPTQTLWNASASYSWKQFQVRLIIDNLADKKGYISGAGARWAAPGLATATGRNIRLSTTIKF